MVVDDNEIFRQRINEIIVNSLHVSHIFHAGSFEEGCRLLKENKINVVLLDISLPDKSGIELLELINNDYPDTIVLMITNHADESYRFVCKSMGADHFFDKSYDFDMIPETISHIGRDMIYKY